MVVCFGPGPLDLWTPHRTFAHFWLVLFFVFFLRFAQKELLGRLLVFAFFDGARAALFFFSFLLLFFCFAAVNLAFAVSRAKDLILLLLYAVHFECDGIESKMFTEAGYGRRQRTANFVGKK